MLYFFVRDVVRSSCHEDDQRFLTTTFRQLKTVRIHLFVLIIRYPFPRQINIIFSGNKAFNIRKILFVSLRSMSIFLHVIK